jgi:polysaccharide biosynthesis protein PslJ
MSVATGTVAREQLAIAALFVAALAALTVGTVVDVPLTGAAVFTIFVLFGLLARHWLLRWDVLTGLLIAVILFIPIRRFVIPGNLPFQLEPYRLFVAVLVGAWGTSLMIDPRVRLRRSGLEAPLWLFIGTAAVSVLANFDHVKSGAQYFDPLTRAVRAGSLDSNVVKAFTFFLSFVLVFYVVVSVVRQPKRVDGLVKLLVGGGVVIAVLSVIESRTGVNYFDRLPRVLPFLQENFLDTVPNRGARLRARGPAEHAIALSAALMMLVPLGVYLAVSTRKLLWWVGTGVVMVGALAAVSRTGVIMFAVIAVVFLCVRPREVKRLWPALVPALVLVHFAIPGTLGTLKDSFFPAGGLVAEQKYQTGALQPGGGRLADLGPSLGEWWERPLVGHGFGTRITVYDPGTGQLPNAIILDDQWLAMLLETGLLGAIAFAWLLLRFLRRCLRGARHDPSNRGWLLGALAASVASAAVGMFVFDALSFIQVAFLLFILMALGVVTLQTEPPRPRLEPVKLPQSYTG